MTRAALLDGTLTLVISHRCRAGPGGARRNGPGVVAAPNGGNETTILPFEVYTRENI